jgi:hypothetical protein
MSDEKETWSVRTDPETKERIDQYAEAENRNRSQAVMAIVEEWAELTNNGTYPPEVLQAEAEDAVPGNTKAAAETTEAARENANTVLDHGGKATAIGAGLMLTWWVFSLPIWFAAPLVGVGAVITALGLVNIVTALYGLLDATTALLGSGEEDNTVETTEGASSDA